MSQRAMAAAIHANLEHGTNKDHKTGKFTEVAGSEPKQRPDARTLRLACSSVSISTGRRRRTL
jgi:hypothetical protein